MEYLNDIELVENSLSWDGRIWVESSPILIDERGSPKIRVLSYRLVSDFQASSMSHSINRNWDIRSKLILKEIITYNSDIICLQEIDHFKDFWFSNLSINDYDSFFLNRTQEKDYHHEGILLAYRRSKFKLIRSYDVELNKAVQDDSLGAVFRESCRTDDVAQIYFLQTKDKSKIPTGLCIANIMTTEHIRSQEIRLAHMRYLTREIEKYNKEFQFPVISCINLNDTPASMSYTLLTTGREPLSAKVPLACTKVKAEATCRGSALIKWFPPKTSIADPPLLYYRIAYRPGGSSILGFRSQVEIPSGDCIKYVEFYDAKNRIKKIIAQEELQFTIPGLCADTPYEFRICAINEMGDGVWSEISDPIILPNPDKAPQMPELENFKDLTQVKEGRELEKMKYSDYNANRVIKADPINSETQLTPRRIDGEINNSISRGKVLPYHINPRVGWKQSLHGARDPILIKELSREIVLGRSMIRSKEGFINPSWNYYQDSNIRSTFQEKNLISPFIEGKDGSTLILDAKEVMNTLGEPNKRHVHSLMFRSSYETSSSGGEPNKTSCFPSISIYEKADCHDYIFYSSIGLMASKTLSIPSFSKFRRGEYPEAKQSYSDPFYNCGFGQYKTFFNQINVYSSSFSTNEDQEAKSKQKITKLQKFNKIDIQKQKSILKDKLKRSREILSKSSSIRFEPRDALWGGKWSPFPVIDSCKFNYYLPNPGFGSTHISLGVDLIFDTNLLPSALYSK